MSNSALLGQVPIVQSIREAGDEGKPIVLRDESITSNAFSEIARNVAKQLIIRNQKVDPTSVVQIKTT